LRESGRRGAGAGARGCSLPVRANPHPRPPGPHARLLRDLLERRLVEGWTDSLKSPESTRRVIETLAGPHPNPDTELPYRNAFEWLVATILSAQSTDARVNMVTPKLFAKYPDAPTLARARQATLEKQIVSTGFFRQKSKALLGMARTLVAEHGGQVPADMDALTKLPGVGRKTANVVLGHALGVPGLPVDRHVLRVSNRIGIAGGDDPGLGGQQLVGGRPYGRTAPLTAPSSLASAPQNPRRNQPQRARRTQRISPQRAQRSQRAGTAE